MDLSYDGELTDEERNAIRAYKRAQNKVLPEDITSDLIWAPDFSPSDYPDLDYVSALRRYLNGLHVYAAGLTKAASLRQKHYENFIWGQGEEEEPGHRHWRMLMNAASEDARQKYDYWKKVHDDELNEVISMHEAMQSAGEKQRQKEYKREERARIRKESLKEKASREKKLDTVGLLRQNPEPREEEKRKLRQEQAALSRRKMLQEEALILAAIEDKDIFAQVRRSTKKTDHVKGAGETKDTRKTEYTSLEILTLLTMLGYDWPMFSKYLRQGKHYSLQYGASINATLSEFGDLADFFITKYIWYSTISDTRKKISARSKSSKQSAAERDALYLSLVHAASYDLVIQDEELLARPELEITPLTQNIIDMTYLMLDATMKVFSIVSHEFKSACLYSLLGQWVAGVLTPDINMDIINSLTSVIVGPMSCKGLLILLNGAFNASEQVRNSPELWQRIKSYIFTIYANDAYIRPLNTLKLFSLPENREEGRALYKARDINFLVPSMQKRTCLKELSDPPPAILPELSFKWKEAYSRFLNSIR